MQKYNHVEGVKEKGDLHVQQGAGLPGRLRVQREVDPSSL